MPLSSPDVWVWWATVELSYIDAGKPKISERKLSQCHFVHQKSHIDWPSRKPGPPLWEIRMLVLRLQGGLWKLKSLLSLGSSRYIIESRCKNTVLQNQNTTLHVLCSLRFVYICKWLHLGLVFMIKVNISYTSYYFETGSLSSPFFLLVILTSHITISRSRVSSGSIVADYRLDDRAIGVRSPAGAKDFSSILCVQTGSGAHPASCTMGTGGPFPGG
jgi:hypothetical protein